MSLFSKRLKSIHKSIAMYGVAALGTLPAWWPVVEVAAKGFFGPDAQTWAAGIIAFATAAGWAIPQRNIPHPES